MPTQTTLHHPLLQQHHSYSCHKHAAEQQHGFAIHYTYIADDAAPITLHPSRYNSKLHKPETATRPGTAACSMELLLFDVTKP
jgi:hypothetical protein